MWTNGTNYCEGDCPQGWRQATADELTIYETERTAQRLEMNCQALWKAAYDYNFKQISGPAIGLLAVGVMQSKPKCLAVQGWVTGIWNLYYQRKALVSADMPTSMLDFASCGDIPYTVSELMTEVSG